MINIFTFYIKCRASTLLKQSILQNDAFTKITLFKCASSILLLEYLRLTFMYIPEIKCIYFLEMYLKLHLSVLDLHRQKSLFALLVYLDILNRYSMLDL